MTTQTPEAEAFLARVAALPSGPGVTLDDVLMPSIEDEAALRRLWATDKSNSRLSNPYVGLVDVFAAPEGIRTTRARVVAHDGSDLDNKYVFPLPEERRREEGEACMVDSLDEFKKNWAIFTEGSLSQLVDWNNVIAAGGSVQACLTPLPEEVKDSKSKRAVRKWYHSNKYPASDVDLFLWGMDKEQAEKKIIQIYEAVRDSVPWDVTCVRTKHTVSIHSQYPYRSVQIVLRLYSSPAEILAGFDVDAPCCAYDGTRVLASPRSIVAQMRQCNTIDVTRRSPSYEVRLSKYAARGFEVYVPTLERDMIDPTIFERSIAKMLGLARLLVLEKLTSTDARYAFLESRRNLRGRPNPLGRYNRNKKTYKGDLKDDGVQGLEMNDYDVATLHIPYGPGWDARRIEKLIYQTDLGMNSTFNPKNKGRRLHRHPAFFGTIQECIEDCCEHCPEPIDDDEKELQKEEDEHYIRGRISFVEENPGRQSISGSFNPIDDGEWSEQVYVKQTEKFFAAIAKKDFAAVKAILDEAEREAALAPKENKEGTGKKQATFLDYRDHVGRSPLQVAIISDAEDVACELIDRGARMIARLVDGKTSLHLAAQRGLEKVVRKLLERSKVNEEEEEKKEKAEEEAEKEGKKDDGERERASSEDDWSSEDVDMDDGEKDEEDEDNGEDDEDNESDDNDEDDDDDGNSSNGSPPETVAEDNGDIPDDNEDEPDILDVNLPDWDFGFTPLAYAVLFGTLPVIKLLLGAGADVKLATAGSLHNALTFTLLREDEEIACKIVERLILGGASSSTADNELRTIFHRAVSLGKLGVVKTLLRCDPGVGEVINCPMIDRGGVIFPLVSAIANRNYPMIATLLAHGAKTAYTEEDATNPLDALSPKVRSNLVPYGVENYLDEAFNTSETALAQHDDVIQLLLALGAPVNIATSYSTGRYSSYEKKKRTLLDWVRYAINRISKEDGVDDAAAEAVLVEMEVEPAALPGWKGYLQKLRKVTKEEEERLQRNRNEDEATKWKKQEEIWQKKELKVYFTEVERLLVARGAKTWNELHPLNEMTYDQDTYPKPGNGDQNKEPKEDNYILLTNGYYPGNYVPEHLRKSYHQLYEACFAGDNEKIQQLCLPAPEDTKSTKGLLNISVQVKHDGDNQYMTTGWTPLYAALAGRRWSTAKLILAIATAQYKSDDDEENKKLKKFKMDIDSDSDSDSDSGVESDDSDATIEKPQFKFVDIAGRTSEIKTNIPPNKMLSDCTGKFIVKDKTSDGVFSTLSGTPLQKALCESDLQMFVHVANLYQSLPTPLELDPHKNLISSILPKDNVDILDEFIRRTGYGIDSKHQRNDEEVVDIPIALNDKSRIYLGLNFHGKKRADLAMQNDPNATSDNDAFVTPLLWEAINHDAKAAVVYLSTNRPLTAYKFYISSHRGEERAERLLRIPDLEKSLPEMLGWKISSIGESPLTAAIISGNLEIMKLLFSKSSKLMKQALNERVKFISYNPILLAVAGSNKDTKIVDFLLSRSVSPAERDLVKGWNIYHFLCSSNSGGMLQHLLSKLPKDVSEALLLQQSKHCMNTPLLIAVKAGFIRCVELVLPYTKTAATMRDANGSLPLHIAVKQGHAEIAKLLLSAGYPETLYAENAVGNTVLEIASLAQLTERVNEWNNDNFRDSIGHLDKDHVSTNPCRYPLSDLEKMLPELRTTIQALEKDGRLKKQTKVAWELNNFATMMESRFQEAKTAGAARKKQPKKVDENPKDQCCFSTTLEVVTRALNENPNDRQLVHLIDVQTSVQAALGRKKLEAEQEGVSSCCGVKHDDEDEEENREKAERDHSMVFRRISYPMRIDPYYDTNTYIYF